MQQISKDRLYTTLKQKSNAFQMLGSNQRKRRTGSFGVGSGEPNPYYKKNQLFVDADKEIESNCLQPLFKSDEEIRKEEAKLIK